MLALNLSSASESFVEQRRRALHSFGVRPTVVFFGQHGASLGHEEELQRRVELLEGEVRELRKLVTAVSGDRAEVLQWKSEEAEQPTLAQAAPPAVKRIPVPEPAPLPAVKSPDDWTTGIISKIGMGLLLLGVAFLLKYSYDQGWLTQTMRVLMGFATGAVLLGTGLYQRRERPPLSAVLLGGAVVCFFGSTFAAYRLYDLIPWSVAIALMVGNTMLGFVMAVREEYPTLGSLAAIGGLATPFALSSGSGNLELLAVYSSVVLLGIGAIYAMRGWQSLLATAVIGGTATVGLLASAFHGEPALIQQILAVGAVLVLVFVTAVMPSLRAQMRQQAGGPLEMVAGTLVPFVSISMIGLIVLGAALPHAALVAVLGFGFFILHHLADDDTFAPGIVAGALTLAAVGIAASVEAEAMSLMTFAVAAHQIAARDEHQGLRLLGYGAAAVLGLWTVVLLVEGAVAPPFINAAGLQMIGAVTTLVLIARTYEPAGIRWGHYYLASFAGMLTVVSQLRDMSGGNAIATTSWGLFALVILVWGVAREQKMALVLGVIAMLLTAAKLLLLDLHNVSAIVRVALFMGFGAAMLAISYMVPRWRR